MVLLSLHLLFSNTHKKTRVLNLKGGGFSMIQTHSRAGQRDKLLTTSQRLAFYLQSGFRGTRCRSMPIPYQVLVILY